ncbi:hypothetical protein C4546_01875 [Candidatus Parcubacteria bacterium]|jgi:hypothetical protein|nr:MAG: hypothetical protein C4546_01875 [Candidatus Parcubacteria bacterium]
MLVFHEQPNQKVRVFAEFRPNPNIPTKLGLVGAGKQVIPKTFFWAGKRYDIQAINLVYQRRRGTKFDWCFAVSDQANVFVLVFNPESLEWTLAEVQGE